MAGMGKRPRGPVQKVENPGKLLARLMKYIGKTYTIHLIVVVICIFASVLANVQGTMFMKSLIDDYITPLLGKADPDFGPLMQAIARVAGFYLLGVICTFIYNRVMVYVTQGTLKNLRVDLFTHMESLPIKYFDTHAHGDIMSVYTNDIDTLRQMISQSMPQLLSSAITIVSVFISMIILSIPLTIVTLIMIGGIFTRMTNNTKEYTFNEDIEVIEVDGKSDKIKLVLSDDDKTHVKCLKTNTIKIENNTLIIKEER